MISKSAIRDQVLNSSSAARLRVPAFEVINRLQKFRPGEQLVGAAVALVAMCEGAGVSLDEVIGVARRAMSDCDGPFEAHIQSIRDYAKNELGRA